MTIRLSQHQILKHFIELGVHIGSTLPDLNPALSKYVLGSQYNFCIIDIRQTFYLLKRALNFITQLFKSRGKLFFVHTSYESNILTYFLKTMAYRMRQPCISAMWTNGTITNYKFVIRKIMKSLFMKRKVKLRFVVLKIFYLLKDQGPEVTFEHHLKTLSKYFRFLFFFIHYRLMKRIPQALFVINPVNINVALHEYRRLKLPIVSLLDTDTDHKLVTYPIPSNDDSLLTVAFFCQLVSKAIYTGRLEFYNSFRSHALSSSKFVSRTNKSVTRRSSLKKFLPKSKKKKFRI
jgi:small subunit ribosomal protein S2